MTTTHPPAQPAVLPWDSVPASDQDPARRPRRLPRLLRGRPDDPSWVRPALLLLLLATGVLYVWGLGASGWANSFYSAAVQAGTKSWKAFFFGSSDSANLITVDKPPASLWVMGLSARAFGVNSWSILVPQALEGVATVGLLYAAVRRWFSPAAGLLAGLVLAVTPVAALMFRFNNPDALLVLLLAASAYAVVRALDQAGTRWLVLAGVLVGFAFLTKMLQALLVVPGFALVYLCAAPTALGRRIGQLALGGLAMVASAGWYIAIVQRWPAASRPYIGGSQHNSFLELALGYNGLGRLTGSETGSVGGGAFGGRAFGGGPPVGATGSMWGQTGWSRLFSSEMGGQIAWLIPAALLLGAAGLWFTRRAPRTDRTRAGLLLWTSWLLVTGLVFSFMQGIFHAYYNVALAPAVAALVGIGAVLLWRLRTQLPARAVLSVAMAITAAWSYVLLDRSPNWLPALRVSILVLGLLAAAALALPTLTRNVATLVALIAVAAGLAGPIAYTLDTVGSPHTGSIVSAGPVGSGGPGGGGPGGGGPGATAGGFRARFGAGGPPGVRPAGGPGGAGGLLQGSKPSSELLALLKQDSAHYIWVAAAVGSNQASGYQLASGSPVMALGGFNGSDPYPTLQQFQAFVAAGKVHYFLGGGQGGGLGMPSRGGSSDTSAIAQWVAANYQSTTVGGTTVYDLTQPVSPT